jgi:hypothetical protein
MGERVKRMVRAGKRAPGKSLRRLFYHAAGAVSPGEERKEVRMHSAVRVCLNLSVKVIRQHRPFAILDGHADDSAGLAVTRARVCTTRVSEAHCLR